MKKLIVLVASLVIGICIYAQIPQGFNYQAIVRNAAGQIISERSVGMQISILQNSTPVYTERFTQTTNQFGLVTLSIGNGTMESGDFSAIDWSDGTYFIKVELDETGGTSYIEIGTSQLLSVPFALLADQANELADNTLMLDGSTLALVGGDPTLEEPLFEVRRSDGEVLFGVYNQGVEINVPYNLPPSKGPKGGFAIGGFDAQKKAPTEEYLRVTRDSTRVYVNQSSKGPKGGFAIGGFDGQKADASNFLLLSPENYFIGHNAGLNNTTGLNNSVLGYEAAFSNTEGSDNVFIGYQSGHSNTLGLNNVFIGKNAGYNNVGEIQTEPFYLTYGSQNVFIGNNAGFSNVSGWTNLFLGNNAGYDNSTGSDNTYIGNSAGQHNVDGSENTSIGTFSGRSNISGDKNVFVGFYAGNKSEENQNTYIGNYSGEKNITGQNNTFIGANSGQNSTGWGNVFIGKSAGIDESGNSKLYISNSSSNNLITGDFAASRLSLNGIVGVNGDYVPGYALYVHGEAFTTGIWQSSDGRLKRDINIIENALDRVQKLKGVTFRWNEETFETKNMNKSLQMGLIAQDVEEQFPELVREDANGYLSVSYDKLSVVLVEAVKEQQAIIEDQQNRIEEKDIEIQSLKERLEKIEAMLGMSVSIK